MASLDLWSTSRAYVSRKSRLAGTLLRVERNRRRSGSDSERREQEKESPCPSEMEGTVFINRCWKLLEDLQLTLSMEIEITNGQSLGC